MEEDIRRLSELNPEFARLWARHEVAEAQMRLRIFRDPDVGELRFIVSELEVSALPGTRLHRLHTGGQRHPRAAAVDLPVARRALADDGELFPLGPGR